jgi:16S rRNA (adenine1518-N6/adenine1519-N6)-dimethyltransferase
MKRQNYRLKTNENRGLGRPKKRFGQHFLKDDQTAERIVSSLKADTDFVIEIGPGRGALTGFLLEKFGGRFHAIEVDEELFQYLLQRFPSMKGRLHNEDFLQMANLTSAFAKAMVDKPGTVSIIGNFPYNISTQILFKILEHREQVVEVVGMFQREVARRVVANEGKKDYGIISVLLSCWYDREYLFELAPAEFNPPPKVHSAVVRLVRNHVTSLGCDEAMFKKVVKAAFNQRRKMLRNSLAGLMDKKTLDDKLFEKRPEQLSLNDFVQITMSLKSNV